LLKKSLVRGIMAPGRPGAQTKRQGLPRPVRALLAGWTSPAGFIAFSLLRLLLRSGDLAPGLGKQFLNLGPEFLPRTPFRLRETGQRLTSHPGEVLILILQPVLDPLAHQAAELGCLLSEQPAILGQVGPKPIDGPLAQAGALRFI